MTTEFGCQRGSGWTRPAWPGNAMNVAGAVLCGGSSRRMGTDKALIELDGVMMAERVARALEAGGCDPVAFVGGDRARLAATGRPYVADRWPDAGPVGGVLSALQSTTADTVVVGACDLPDLSPSTVRLLIGPDPWPEECDVRVADSGRLEPMLACWSRATVGLVEGHFAGGVSALREILGALRIARVPVEPAEMRNINRPGDLPRGGPPIERRVVRPLPTGDQGLEG